MTSVSPDKFGFVILCPERNLGGLQNTVNSIRRTYPKSPHLCVVGKDAIKQELDEMSRFCKTIQGENTITSLINRGMAEVEADWNAIVFAGSWITSGLYRKFCLFVKDQRDILFPVVNRKTNFVEGSMNGLIVHRETFREVGKLPGIMHKTGVNDLELLKLFWAIAAIDKGCHFKAIVGMKVC